MRLNPQTISSALENRRRIADELNRMETGEEPRTSFDPSEMRQMLGVLDLAIARYRSQLH